MMFKRLYRLLTGTLSRQLTLGIVLIVTSIMALFVWDLSQRQRDLAIEQQTERAVGVARSVALSGAVWLVSRDLSGLEEIVQGVGNYPDLQYAIVLDTRGEVLAHTDTTRRGQYLTDLPTRGALTVMHRGIDLVDVANPILLNDRLIGWVRIGVAGTLVKLRLAQIRQSGILYTLIALTLMIAFASVASIYMTRRLHDIERVASAVQKGHAGHPHLRAQVEGIDEAAQLARQFNAMLDTLEQRDQALKASEETFRTLFETAPHGVVYQGLDGRITKANPAALRILGLTLDQMRGMTSLDPHWKMVLEDGSDVPGDQHPSMQTLRSGQAISNAVRGVFVPGRGYVWLLMSATPLFKDGKLDQVYVIFEDITDRHLMQGQVRQVAFYDPLTQLPNRRLFSDRLTQAMLASKRNDGYGALMFLDLDNFKPLNDSHGHDAGDLLLIEVAQRIKNCVREIDTVARFGGDEFVVMLIDLDTDMLQAQAHALSVAEKIRSSLAEPYRLEIDKSGIPAMVEHHCTASIGVSLFIHRDGGQEEILRRADTAMYRAKEAGRDRIQLYTPFA